MCIRNQKAPLCGAWRSITGRCPQLYLGGRTAKHSPNLKPGVLPGDLRAGYAEKPTISRRPPPPLGERRCCGKVDSLHNLWCSAARPIAGETALLTRIRSPRRPVRAGPEAAAKPLLVLLRNPFAKLRAVRTASGTSGTLQSSLVARRG